MKKWWKGDGFEIAKAFYLFFLVVGGARLMEVLACIECMCNRNWG